MAETLESRQSTQAALEEIQKTLVAASNKMAQLQLDAIDDQETSDAVAGAMSELAAVIGSIESLTESYHIETNRMANSGELDA
ncbi:MAG: hypothetical protein ACRDVL_11470 [Acidimicrobiia bacterium]